MLTQFRDDRMVVYQRGRSCKAHPFKDTGSRDGFVTLSERAVVQMAHNLRAEWSPGAALVQFHQLFPDMRPGHDATADEVFAGGVRSMGREPPARRRTAARGTGGTAAHVTASGAPLRTEQGPQAPLSSGAEPSVLTDLQAVLVSLARPGAVRLGGAPLIRAGLCTVDELGVPGCGDWAGSLVQRGGDDTGNRIVPLRQVAAAAGLSAADVAAASAPTWGADSEAGVLAAQDAAFVRVAQRAWPTARVVSPAAKRTRGAMLFGPSWPKTHWRVREACWVRHHGGMVAVLPFTIAAMNHTGQPSHRPPATWLALAVACSLGPPFTAASGAASSAPRQGLLAGTMVSAVSQPFALVSCNDKPRKLESRNNRRLAFLPKLEGPDGTGAVLTGSKLQGETKAFVAAVVAHRQPPEQELAATAAGMRAVLPRQSLLQSQLGAGESAEADAAAAPGTAAAGPQGSAGRVGGTIKRRRARPVGPVPSPAALQGSVSQGRPGGAVGHAIDDHTGGAAAPAAAADLVAASAAKRSREAATAAVARLQMARVSSGMQRGLTMSSASASSHFSSDSDTAAAFRRATGGSMRRLESDSSSLGPVPLAAFAVPPAPSPRGGPPRAGWSSLPTLQQLQRLQHWAAAPDLVALSAAAYAPATSYARPTSAGAAAGYFPSPAAHDWSHTHWGPAQAAPAFYPGLPAPSVMSGGSGNPPLDTQRGPGQSPAGAPREARPPPQAGAAGLEAGGWPGASSTYTAAHARRGGAGPTGHMQPPATTRGAGAPVLMAMPQAAPGRIGDGTTSTMGGSDDDAGSGSILSQSAADSRAGLAAHSAGGDRPGAAGPGSTGATSHRSGLSGSLQGYMLPRGAAWAAAPQLQAPFGVMRDAASSFAGFQPAAQFGAHMFRLVSVGAGTAVVPVGSVSSDGQQPQPAAPLPAVQQAASQQPPQADGSSIGLTRATSSRLQRRQW